MNVGTIVEPTLKVRLVRLRPKMIPRGGRLLGEVEEYFIEMLVPGVPSFSRARYCYEAIVSDESCPRGLGRPKVLLLRGRKISPPLTRPIAQRSFPS